MGTVLIFIKYAQMLGGHSKKRFHIAWNQKIVILLLAATCFLGGVFGPMIMSVMFDFDVYVSASNYFSKFFIYLATLLVDFVYRYVYLRMRLFTKYKSWNLL